MFIQKSTRVAASYLRRAESLRDPPDALRSFFDVLRSIFVELRNDPKPTGMKTIGTYCAMIPSELIWAAGAMPVRLCSGSYTAYTIGDDIVPRDACPLVKSIMGFGEIEASPLYSSCSLMVIPVTCDCKKKLAGMLERLKPTVTLHVPSSKERDADMEEYVRELYRLIPILEEVTGQQITPQSLAEAINQKGYAQYEMSRFLTYRQNDPPLLLRQLNEELEEWLAQKPTASVFW